MHRILLVLVGCALVASAFPTGRGLLEEATCPGYRGPTHNQHDVQFEVTYLRPMPSPEHLAKYPDALEHPLATLYGRAIAHFSVPLGIEPKIEYFGISKLEGKVLGLESSPQGCDVILDFVVPASCEDDCIPIGACIELAQDRINKDLSYSLPYRKGCKALDVSERPRCLDMSMVGMSMGRHDSGMPYTEKDKATMMIIFSRSFNQYIEFHPRDFTVTGPEGTECASVKAATPNNPANIAYIVTIKHGKKTGSEDEEVKVCFAGGETMKHYGMPFDAEKTMCSRYMMSKKAPKEVKQSIEMRGQRDPMNYCL